jgi:hypothetical protein
MSYDFFHVFFRRQEVDPRHFLAKRTDVKVVRDFTQTSLGFRR